jgi:hypothetical protein
MRGKRHAVANVMQRRADTPRDRHREEACQGRKGCKDTDRQACVHS